MLHYTALDVLAWSREGCKTLPGKALGTVRCECTHLTNFALLLDDDRRETTKLLFLLNQVGELLFSSCLVRFRRMNPVQTEQNRLPRCLLNISCTFNLHHVSSGKWTNITFNKEFNYF